MVLDARISRGDLNINKPSYFYSNSHYKDEMVSCPSYLYNGSPHSWKDGLSIETGPRQVHYHVCIYAWAQVEVEDQIIRIYPLMMTQFLHYFCIDIMKVKKGKLKLMNNINISFVGCINSVQWIALLFSSFDRWLLTWWHWKIFCIIGPLWEETPGHWCTGHIHWCVNYHKYNLHYMILCWHLVQK